jgi:hypothetical protein
VSDDGEKQSVLRLRGGAPEEEDLDDQEAFYEDAQVAQPVTVVGAPTNEVYVPPSLPETPVQQAMTVSDAAAVSLEEIPDDVLVARVGDESEVEVTVLGVPQVYPMQLVGKIWLKHSELVNKVERWWESREPPNVELVNRPIVFMPIHLTVSVELPEVRDQRYRVSRAEGRCFFQTSVAQPVYVPDANDPEAYSAANQFRLHFAMNQRGYAAWHQAVQAYCEHNAPEVMRDREVLTAHQASVIYHEWYQAKCRERQDTDKIGAIFSF